MTIDEAIERYKKNEEKNLGNAAKMFQKYLNYQSHDYKDSADKYEETAEECRQIIEWLEELKGLKDGCDSLISEVEKMGYICPFSTEQYKVGFNDGIMTVKKSILKHLKLQHSISPTQIYVTSNDAISKRIITAHLKQRLWQIATNNITTIGSLSDAYADIAENRLDLWMDEITEGKP